MRGCAILAILCVIGGIVCGCSSGPPSPFEALKPTEAAELNAEHSRFEKSEDPPFTAATHFAAGQLAESQNATARAIASYEAAVKLDPRHLPALYRLGVLHARSGNHAAAISTWQRYTEVSGYDPAAYANLGFAYELSGAPEKAEIAYREGIARDPANALCRINYGLLLARLGRTAEAVEQMEVVLPPAMVHYNLGSVYERTGRVGAAQVEYAKALQVDPNLDAARQRLAQLGAKQ